MRTRSISAVVGSGLLLIAGLATSCSAKGGAGSAPTPRSVTVAGGMAGAAGPATSTGMVPAGLAAEGRSLYVSDDANDVVWQVDTVTGSARVVAGIGQPGHSGDNGPATRAALDRPEGLAVDAAGNLFIADAGNNRVRELTVGDGILTTVAGDGRPGFSGDGGPARRAELNDPYAVAVTAQDLYIADTENNRIRRVALPGGTITTAAGNGSHSESGDGGDPRRAAFAFPEGVAAGPDRSIYISDTDNSSLRRVDPSGRVVTTVAGNGLAGFEGDGGRATAARLDFPIGIAMEPGGGILIADTSNDAVRSVGADGSLTTVSGDLLSALSPESAGAPAAGFGGDGGLGTRARLSAPSAVAVGGDGTVYIADAGNDRVRRLSAGGIITTVAGNGTPGLSGADPGRLAEPSGVAADGLGDLYISDTGNDQVKEIGPQGAVRVIAGTGVSGDTGDGGPATAATLSSPVGLSLDDAGHLLIADSGNDSIRSIDLRSGSIATAAGDGQPGFAGDRGPATDARLDDPTGVAAAPGGTFFIADAGNNRIREVDGVSGVISTVAGNGTAVEGGDGGPASSAGMEDPTGVALDAQGDVFVADRLGNRIRKIDGVSGVISTVAGDGRAGTSPDGTPADASSLGFPYAIALDARGDLYLADSDNGALRELPASGHSLVTLAGGSSMGGPSAALSQPTGLAVIPGSRVAVSSGGDDRIVTVASAAVGALPAPSLPSWARQDGAAPDSATPLPAPVGAAPDSATPLPAPVGAAGPVGPVGPPVVALLGDSLAYTLGQGLVPLAALGGVDLVNDGTLGCGVITGGPLKTSGVVSAVSPICNAWTDTWAHQLLDAHATVAAILVGRWEIVDRVLGGRWSHIGEPAFDRALSGELARAARIALDRGARPVFLTMPYLRPDPRPDAPGFYPESVSLRVDEFDAMLDEVAQLFGGRVSVFDLGSVLSPGGHYALSVDDRTVRWSDGTHIAVGGAAVVAPGLLEALRASH